MESKYSYHSRLSLKTRFLNTIRKLFRNEKMENFLVENAVKSDEWTIWSKLIPAEYLYEKNSWRLYNRDGLKLKLDLSKVTDHAKYYNHPEVSLKRLLNMVQKDDVIIDVGANIGITMAELAKRASAGMVIGYEPSVENFKRLNENLELNGFHNCKTYNKGIGSAKGKLKLYDPVDSNPGMKRIIDDPQLSTNGKYEEVEIETLDEEVRRQNLEKIDIIKIDVEGFEMEVLKGAQKVLERFGPVLFIELVDSNLKDQNSSAKMLVNFLFGFGYSISNALTGEEIGHQTDLSGSYFDILCTKKQ